MNTASASIRSHRFNALALLALGLGVVIVVTVLLPRPLTSPAVDPGSALLPHRGDERRLYALNESLYPSDGNRVPVAATAQQRLYSLNETFYPSSAHSAQAQRLQRLNEALYPPESAPLAPSRQQRLLQLNETLYPPLNDAPRFWTGQPR